MLNFSETTEYDTWEEVFYDYVKTVGWNQVRIGFNGIEYALVYGDSIEYEDREGNVHYYEFPKDVETLMDAHVLENNMSPRELMRRTDLEYFAMD